jgi:hypothetical protein
VGKDELGIVLDDSSTIDLSVLLIVELAESVRGIYDVFKGPSSINIGDVVFSIDRRDVNDDARDRLCALMDVVRQIVSSEKMAVDDVVKDVLKLDGWSWTDTTLRTPLWLRDVQEWPWSQVIEWHSELRCIVPFISL